MKSCRVKFCLADRPSVTIAVQWCKKFLDSSAFWMPAIL